MINTNYLINDDAIDNNQSEILPLGRKVANMRGRYNDVYLATIVGHNFKLARRYASYTTYDVMQQVFGAHDEDKNLNRISEIESGAKLPSFATLIKLTLLYGISLDFIFGLTNERERNFLGNHINSIARGVRQSMLDISDMVSKSVMQLSSQIPKNEAQRVLDAAKKCISEYQKCRCDIVFLSFYSEFDQSFVDLDKSIKATDKIMLRHSRLADLNFEEKIKELEKPIEKKAIINDQGIKKREIERHIGIVLGENLKKARQVANLTKYDVIKLIYGNCSDEQNKATRLSEIEAGSKFPSYSILLELSQIYEVSLDYLFGLTTEMERNMACSETGIINQSIRESMLDFSDRINESLIHIMEKVPKHEAQLLIVAAKKCVFSFNANKEGLAELSHYVEFQQAMSELQKVIVSTETLIAKHIRLVEMCFQDAIKIISERNTLYIEK